MISKIGNAIKTFSDAVDIERVKTDPNEKRGRKWSRNWNIWGATTKYSSAIAPGWGIGFGLAKLSLFAIHQLFGAKTDFLAANQEPIVKSALVDIALGSVTTFVPGGQAIALPIAQVLAGTDVVNAVVHEVERRKL